MELSQLRLENRSYMLLCQCNLNCRSDYGLRDLCMGYHVRKAGGTPIRVKLGCRCRTGRSPTDYLRNTPRRLQPYVQLPDSIVLPTYINISRWQNEHFVYKFGTEHLTKRQRLRAGYPGFDSRNGRIFFFIIKSR